MDRPARRGMNGDPASNCEPTCAASAPVPPPIRSRTPGLLTSRDNAVIHVWRSASRTGDVKTPQSKRSLELPQRAVTALHAHRKHRAAERLAAGAAWQDGRMYHSDALN
jgi:hypothetical protein